jgi:hypothetical protein
MKYKIMVELILDNEKKDTRYPDFFEIYHQYLEELDLAGLVNWINRPSLKEVIKKTNERA